MDYYTLNKRAIVEYIKSGEKSPRNFSIGLEFEHIVIDKTTKRSINYFEENGVERILKDFKNLGWNIREENGHVLAAEKDGDLITLEPGAQIELSAKNSVNLREIEKRYLAFLRDIKQILKKYDFSLIALGYHPVSKIEEIPFIPKKRYEYMANYLGKKDVHGHNMMKGTASLQAVIDYENEEDFKMKYRTANFLGPILSLIFDNTPIFEGNIWEKNLARTHIWNHVDKDRSRVLPGSLNKIFGYEDYAEYVLNKPAVISMIDGKPVFTDQEIVSVVYQDRIMNNEEIEHVLSMFFPDVRVKKYIELRMCDSVPYPYNMALGAIIKGIFYDESNLKYYFEKSKSSNDHIIQNLKDEMIESRVIDQIHIEAARELLERAEKGLEINEAKFIQPIKELLEKYTNMSTLIKRGLKNGNEDTLATALADNFISE
ncbi:glutamate-cysteine ligase family protein [Alkalibacter mobilis]|uniref:glutamate-cysteine ligase family protein n=1 Tax=Alkalibacter mobilis TaxID=2787712 RepID=UPI00189F370B|nr:glutamate-cysteine ligase family protein [Alkalibacter mobilis]MBF7097452.1 glutamate--cysteine ligase [Alkalibacter mobilis]